MTDERQRDAVQPGPGGPGAGGGDLAEERRLILRMLEAGRITPEQAVELLKALQAAAAPGEGAGAPGAGAGQPGAGAGPGEPAAEAPQRGGDFMGWVESTVSRMGELADELGERVSRALSSPPVQERLTEMSERLEELGRTLADRMSRAFGQLSRSAYPEHAVPRELTGAFAEGALPAVELAAADGSIRVVALPASELGGPRAWRLRLEPRVRARSREEAEREAAERVQVDQGPARLTVRADDADGRWGPVPSVDMELALPVGMAVALQASTANGTIRVQGLSADSVEVRSTNGRLDLADVSARRVRAASTNGAVLLERVRAGLVEARSTNGSVTGVVAADELAASSVNGSVTVRPLADAGEAAAHRRVEASAVNGSTRVVLPAEIAQAAARGELGLYVEASAGWGEARIELPGEAVAAQVARPGQQRAVYQSPGFERAPRTLWVKAASRQGSAVVAAEGA